MARVRSFAAFILIVFSCAGGADELLMKNGSRLVGTLVSADADIVVFNTPFAGDITINQVNIETIITENEVTLLMDDNMIYRNKRVVAQEDSLIVFDEKERPVRFEVGDIKMINPEPWRLGDGYKWSGEVNAALESERGNSDSDELDVDFESVWRSLADRYTIRGVWELDEANGDRNKNKGKLRTKYDRFSKTDPDNYAGVQAAFEHDEFADLDLRTIAGPYIGRQFYEGYYLSLHGEVGIVYVDERFDVAKDEDYWGPSWELRLSSGIIPRSELYVYQDGLLDFTDPDNLILNTTVGIKFPLIFGFQAAVEALYEFDGGAVDDVDSTDETIKAKLGYSW